MRVQQRSGVGVWLLVGGGIALQVLLCIGVCVGSAYFTLFYMPLKRSQGAGLPILRRLDWGFNYVSDARRRRMGTGSPRWPTTTTPVAIWKSSARTGRHGII
jgi:hypothetical protein